MGIDASLALGVRPVQLPDPMNKLAQVMQIRGMQDESAMRGMQADQLRQTIADTRATNEAYRAAVGPDGTLDRNKLYQTLVQSGRGSVLPGLQKQFAESDAKQADIGKTNAEADAKRIEAAHKRVDGFGQVMGFVQQAPTIENAQAAVQHLVRLGVLQPEQAAASLAPIAQNPTPDSIKQWAALGFRAALQAKDQLQQYQTRNTGGTTDTIAIDPVTGQVRVANSVQNTQSPDNAATVAEQSRAHSMQDARERQRIAQSEQHFQTEQSRPVYMQTDAGLVALPARPAPGQQPTGTPVTGPNGENLGKPLKDIPAAQNTALIENAKALQNIDTAIAAIKQYPQAMGAANYLGDGIRQRIDPKGVSVRAQVANIGGQRYHDISGAAVSVGEAKRLQPFIPADTDGAQAAIDKLENLRREYLSVNDMLQRTYSKDQGFRPSPVQPAAAPAAGQFRVLGVEK